VSASGIYRRQNGIILLAGLAPLLINLPTLAGLLPKWRIDPTLPGFAISITLMWWGLFRLEILDLIPVAHSVLLENMRDGMLVIDAQNRIVDLNPMAQRVLGIGSGPFIGQQAGERLIHWNPLRQVCCSDSSNPGETILEDNEKGLYLEARVTPLTDQYGRSRGHLILVRDISEQHRTRLERETLIGELQTALGQVKTLSGLLPICAGCKKIRDRAGEWHKLESYLHHHTEAQLTHGLCPSCIEELYPGV
jgi:PAS domain S-box-containing protein